MPAFLVPVESGPPIPLEKAILLIGRGAECDISITNSRKVSRKHCCLAQVNDRYVIRDLGSTNGVTVNGKLVEREAVVTVGDELIVGDVRFRLRSSNEAPRSESATAVRTEKPPLIRPAIPPAISQEVPVPLPEPGDADFAIEITNRSTPPAEPPSKLRRKHRPESDVIPLQSDSDQLT